METAPATHCETPGRRRAVPGGDRRRRQAAYFGLAPKGNHNLLLSVNYFQIRIRDKNNSDIRRRRLREIDTAWQEIVSQPAVHKLQNSDARFQKLCNVVANSKKT
jgi:hypothetical protein